MSEWEVVQSCLTLFDPMDYSLPGSSVHGIFEARIPDWVAISFSRRSSQPRNWTQVSRIVSWCFIIWLCGSPQTVENSSRDRNIKPPYLPPKKSVYRLRSKLEPDMEEQTMFQIRKEVRQGCTLSPCLLNICRVYHEKCWAGRSTSWNQGCQEKYQ